MKAGAVIVDLSAEGGGNCEGTKPGETTEIGQVTIVAPLNVPSLLGEDASELYAKNQYNLLLLMNEKQHHHDRLGGRGSGRRPCSPMPVSSRPAWRSRPNPC